MFWVTLQGVYQIDKEIEVLDFWSIWKKTVTTKSVVTVFFFQIIISLCGLNYFSGCAFSIAAKISPTVAALGSVSALSFETKLPLLSICSAEPCKNP